MKILGLCHDVLICSACVVEDGRVVAAIPEERLDRVKQSRVFPTRAIEACLRMAGLGIDDIDEIAVAWNPGIELETAPSGFVNARRWRSEHLSQVPARFMQQFRRRAASEMSHTGLWLEGPPITYVDHYLAHLGNALHLSPFPRAAVAILDGRAERSTALLALADGVKVERLEVVDFPHSIGLLYGAVTQFLGFKPDSDEWKVMALASYASGENEFTEPMRRLIRVDDRGRFSVSLEHFEWFNFWDPRMYSDLFVSAFGPPRQKEEPLTSRHERIAAALQLVFEETLAKILGHLHARTGCDQLVVSGGCFMNSVFNGKITTLTPFKACFISSCPDDSGTSVGAALHLHGIRTGRRELEQPRHNYWGPSFTDEECLAAAKRYKLPNARRVASPSSAAAEDLTKGKLVGWFQGPMEFGQRALGNRSILADPRRPGVKDEINAAVKYRESFRPFAPAILAEHTAEWFQCSPGTTVPFMERVIPFRPERRGSVPGVVHVDGSGRVQTVDEQSGTRFRHLVEHFERLTGVPLVLNTSFNLNGEPVACSPEDAIRTFFSCGLDVLYLGDVRIDKGSLATGDAVQ